MELRPMRSWIHHSRGKVLRQALVDLPELGLHQDMMTRHGFEGRDTHLYRRNEPTAWKRVEGDLDIMDVDGTQLDPTDLENADGGPLRIFANDDLAIWISRRSANMTYTNRNGDGDELYFVHKGTGTFYTEYGPIPYEPGDWILLPKGVSYRVRPDTAENYFLIIESVEEIGFADNGPIGRRAPVDPTVLFVPSPALDELGDGRNEEGEYPVRVKHQNRYSTLFYDFDPIDAEGWKGDYFPFKVNLRDVRNIMSNDIHIMPSAYATFATSAVLIGAVMPRPFEQRPGVERVPPFHRNLDYDEFMFIHDGTALGVPVPKASIAHYPRGAHHGLPAAAAAKAREFGPGSMADNEFVIVDTARALFPTDDLLASRRKHTALREAAAES